MADLRSYLVANMWDGSDAGTTTMPVAGLVDEVVELVALWFIEESGASEMVENYYSPPAHPGRRPEGS